MPDISQSLKLINDEGFSVDDLNNSELTIAFLSLRSAYRAWLSTYQSFRGRLNIVDPDFEIPAFEGDEDPLRQAKLIRQSNHSAIYFEQYSETIFHFQHFIELIIKDILRKEHELLVSDSAKHPLILWKLIKNEEITSEEGQKLFSIEFSEALKRIISYIESNNIDNNKFGFIKEGKFVLQSLNILRNRLVHRGTFVLPYASLDEFIGKYLIPIVVAFLELPEYKKQEKFWKYDVLACGLDPISEIGNEFQTVKANYQKIAFLKELGRAAFQNPIKKRGLKIQHGDRNRAEMLAANEAKKENSEVYDIINCPVCGSNSLVRFFEYRTDTPDPEDAGAAWLETTNVLCYCCSFSIYYEINNASNFGFGIDDFWVKEDLE